MSRPRSRRRRVWSTCPKRPNGVYTGPVGGWWPRPKWHALSPAAQWLYLVMVTLDRESDELDHQGIVAARLDRLQYLDELEDPLGPPPPEILNASPPAMGYPVRISMAALERITEMCATCTLRARRELEDAAMIEHVWRWAGSGGFRANVYAIRQHHLLLLPRGYRPPSLEDLDAAEGATVIDTRDALDCGPYGARDRHTRRRSHNRLVGDSPLDGGRAKEPRGT